MKVLLATQKPFAAKAVEGIVKILTEAGHEVVKLEKYAEQSDFVAAVADVDAIIIRSDKVTAEVIGAAPKLKIVVRAGAGYDNVDLAAATAAKVVVMNTPGQNSNAVAELALGLMIFMAALHPGHRQRAAGQAPGRPGLRQRGPAGRPEGEGPRDEDLRPGPVPHRRADRRRRRRARPLRGGALCHVRLPLHPHPGPACHHPQHHEEGLLKALEEREDLKYVTDVMPDNYDQLTKKFGYRVFATPKKMGAQTSEANINAGLAAARQIADYFATGNTKFQVNK